jgi:hypothetical protein
MSGMIVGQKRRYAPSMTHDHGIRLPRRRHQGEMY